MPSKQSRSGERPSRSQTSPQPSQALPVEPAPARSNRGGAMADDGDALNFCSTCAFSAVCIGNGYDKDHLRELHVLVEHVGPFAEGEHLFREGDDFNSIAAVRSG